MNKSCKLNLLWDLVSPTLIVSLTTSIINSYLILSFCIVNFSLLTYTYVYTLHIYNKITLKTFTPSIKLSQSDILWFCICRTKEFVLYCMKNMLILWRVKSCFIFWYKIVAYVLSRTLCFFFCKFLFKIHVFTNYFIFKIYIICSCV